ncbi:hypothetical protein AYJ05_07170 [Corynebacterium stationis]|uniref:Uncharacterized protein n=1 Tax=Corynebacterium stationis TaxID=1705 RepID=A0A177I882_9CORY|nr:hypothetical protein AYJ05_07170 [Corynebacterium stationis]
MAGAVKIGDPKIYRESHAEADNNRYLTGFSELLIINREIALEAGKLRVMEACLRRIKVAPKGPRCTAGLLLVAHGA